MFASRWDPNPTLCPMPVYPGSDATPAQIAAYDSAIAKQIANYAESLDKSNPGWEVEILDIHNPDPTLARMAAERRRAKHGWVDIADLTEGDIAHLVSLSHEVTDEEIEAKIAAVEALTPAQRRERRTAQRLAERAAEIESADRSLAWELRELRIALDAAQRRYLRHLEKAAAATMRINERRAALAAEAAYLAATRKPHGYEARRHGPGRPECYLPADG